MRLTTLSIRARGMRVDIRATSHNTLRWAVQAIDSNPQLVGSLLRHSQRRALLLTDSIYLLTHRMDATQLPLHTHVILWDGLNSHVELMAQQPALLARADLQFYVVGWLAGVGLPGGVQIAPLYAPEIDATAQAWKRLSVFGPAYYAPGWYRLLTTCLTLARSAKNAWAEPAKHRALQLGGRVVFCGLVTPTPANVQAFFIGVDWPLLLAAAMGLAAIEFSSEPQVVDQAVDRVVATVVATAAATLAVQEKQSAAVLACIYSVLNVAHRIQTLSVLHRLNAALFVNETRNGRRFDPYDSFSYRNNLYLDFGSTRGPDTIYPRTLDLHMTDKRFLSVRLLTVQAPWPDYLATLSPQAFTAACRAHAQSVLAMVR